jgi:hypothetical protein
MISATCFRPVPELIDPKRSFSMIENERFGLFFAKTRSINLGMAVLTTRVTFKVGIFLSLDVTGNTVVSKDNVCLNLCPWPLQFYNSLKKIAWIKCVSRGAIICAPALYSCAASVNTIDPPQQLSCYTKFSTTACTD